MVTQAERQQLLNARQRYEIVRNGVNQQCEQAEELLQRIQPATDVEIATTKETITQYDNRLKDMERVYNSLLVRFNTVDGAVEQHIQQQMEVEERVIGILGRLAGRLEQLRRDNAQPQQPIIQQPAAPQPQVQILQDHQARAAMNSVRDFKLTEERKFDGNPLTYQGFWDLFNRTVHTIDNVPATVKMTKLLDCIKGEAHELLEGLSINDNNYNRAIELLQQRFGDQEKIKAVHQTSLENMKAPRNKDYKELNKHVNQIEKTLRNLQNAGENIEQTMYIRMVKQRLPVEMVGKMEEHHPGAWTMQGLRDEIQWYMKIEDGKNQIRQAQQPADAATQDNKAATESSSTLISQQGGNRIQQMQGKCTFCERTNHRADECRQYTSVEQRKQRLREQQKCYNCLGPRHTSRQCKFLITCKKCGAQNDHHESLCMSQQRGAPSRQTFNQRNPGNPGPRTPYHLQGQTNYQRPAFPRPGYSGQVFPRPFPPRYQSAVVRRQQPVPRQPYQNQYQGTPSRTQPALYTAEQDYQEEYDNTEHTQGLQRLNLNVPMLLAQNEEMVIMKTIIMTIRNPDNNYYIRIRAFADTGSHNSYITDRVRQLLGLMGIGPAFNLKVGVFGSTEVKQMTATPVTLVMKFLDGQERGVKMHSVPVITKKILRYPFDTTVPQGIILADTIPTKIEETEIDMLIGNDYYDNIISGKTMMLDGGLIAKASKCGWIPTGRIKVSEKSARSSAFASIPYVMAMTATGTKKNEEDEMEQFWSFESIGVKDKDTKKESSDAVAKKKFEDTLEYENGRYHATWPWKDDVKNHLPDNGFVATRQFGHLNRQLQEDPELLKKYAEIMDDQEKQGIIEEVSEPDKPTVHLIHYIPYHHLITPLKDTTKVRIVYNGSARANKHSVSLNDCIHRGPVMLDDLIGLVLRFRMYTTAIISDIAKAFLQVGLQMPDRDVTRFYWLKDSKDVNKGWRVMRFCRIPFGIIASPYILAAVIEFHLAKYGTPLAERIMRGLYVDNVCLGTNDSNLSSHLATYCEAKKMFASAGMNLREWVSNDQRFNRAIPEEDRAKPIVKVLGYTWNTSRDVIVPPSAEKILGLTNPTKKQYCKAAASLYDPLGLFCPVTTKSKLFMQSLWEPGGIKWDSKLNKEQLNGMLEVQKELKGLDKLAVQRCVVIPDSTTNELIVFCDASGKAYCASVYLKQQYQDQVKVTLIFAKTRLAPRDGCTIPRLELMSMLIAKRCIQYVEKNMVKMVIANKTIFSDSQVVLAWMQSGKALDTFVMNRILEIRELSDVTFRYVDTHHNPADLPTRGIPVWKLQASIWMHGPQWLKKPSTEWPLFHYPPITPMYLQAMTKDQTVKTTALIEAVKPQVIDMSRFGTARAMERTVAYVLRFGTPRRMRKKGVLTSEEIKDTVKGTTCMLF